MFQTIIQIYLLISFMILISYIFNDIILDSNNRWRELEIQEKLFFKVRNMDQIFFFKDRVVGYIDVNSLTKIYENRLNLLIKKYNILYNDIRNNQR